ncbi:hypothetical protein LTR95_004107 [Oleoguttula sp. CCFEE 5521]
MSSNVSIRLLSVETLEFKSFPSEPEPYAIASHRWFPNEHETTYRDVCARRNTTKHGYKKVLGFAKHVRTHYRGISWLWIDTCCIDKEDKMEHSNSIDSMYDWYSNAAICLAYLVDVPYSDDEDTLSADFQRSVWFTRRWTLQELVAPKVVVFLTRQWTEIGCKGAGRSRGTLGHVEEDVSEVTGIPVAVLEDPAELSSVSLLDIISWAKDRETSREEDMWYCLYGLAKARGGSRYGEGASGARGRFVSSLVQNQRIRTDEAETIVRQDNERRAQLERVRRALPMYQARTVSGTFASSDRNLDIESAERSRQEDLADVVRRYLSLFAKGYSEEEATDILVRREEERREERAMAMRQTKTNPRRPGASDRESDRTSPQQKRRGDPSQSYSSTLARGPSEEEARTAGPGSRAARDLSSLPRVTITNFQSTRGGVTDPHRGRKQSASPVSQRSEDSEVSPPPGSPRDHDGGAEPRDAQQVTQDVVLRLTQGLRAKGYSEEEAREKARAIIVQYRATGQLNMASKEPARSGRAPSRAATLAEQSRTPRTLPSSQRPDQVESRGTTANFSGEDRQMDSLQRQVERVSFRQRRTRSPGG